uniref:Uncharacterized protein n=1 Tax=Rhizophora mucronata TaxID=61149 RepID=A0A2P2QAZ1_RHIMU
MIDLDLINSLFTFNKLIKLP